MSAPTTVALSSATDAEPTPRAHVAGSESLRIVSWSDPVADPLGVHPCSRYVEQYWLGVIGPSTTWLLRRLNYGLEAHPDGFLLDLADTAHALGLGDRRGKNSPFRRALQRLVKFELARPYGPGGLAVRTRIPPLALRHVQRLSPPLQASHRQWQAEQRLAPIEQMRRRARRLALRWAAAGHDRSEIERRLTVQQFHPTLASESAGWAVAQPDTSSPGAGVAPADGLMPPAEPAQPSERTNDRAN